MEVITWLTGPFRRSGCESAFVILPCPFIAQNSTSDRSPQFTTHFTAKLKINRDYWTCATFRPLPANYAGNSGSFNGILQLAVAARE